MTASGCGGRNAESEVAKRQSFRYFCAKFDRRHGTEQTDADRRIGGKFGLIDKLTGAFAPRNRTTLRGVGDDAAVIAASRSEATLVSTDLLMEGIDFDLTYFPLKHLGYKTVTVGASDILAMNARPEQLLLSLGVSSKFSVEALQEFYEGVRLACEELNIDLAGGDTTASVTGLTVNVTAIGRAQTQ